MKGQSRQVLIVLIVTDEISVITSDPSPIAELLSSHASTDSFRHKTSVLCAEPSPWETNGIHIFSTSAAWIKQEVAQTGVHKGGPQMDWRRSGEALIHDNTIDTESNIVVSEG